MSDDEPTPHFDIALRKRLMRLGIFFVFVQVVVATIVVIRARWAERRREADRPATYPSRSFEPVLVEQSDDEARLYMRGEDLLHDMVDAIDRAKQEVMLETYILVDDAAGQMLRDALGRAAQRGVKVFVLWDWLQSDRTIDKTFFPPGIELHAFKRVKPGPGALRPSNVLRDHRKMLVVDQRIAFVGGYNIGSLYMQWRDTHLRLEGRAAREVANAFSDFWNHHTHTTSTTLPNVTERPWDPHVVVHRNDPSLAIFPIRGMYLEAIDRAEQRIWVTTAYFVPDRAFRASLAAAARRGVDVRVLLPARSNHPLTDQLAHGMFDELLTAGARVFLYRDFMLHAKTCVIDSEWSTIGTANLDRWSMLGNHEVNLEIRSHRVAEQLGAMFELDLTNCDEVQLDGWRRRPFTWRASERVLRSLAPLM